MAERSSFVVVANRLPVDEVTTPDGERQWRRSPGGLVTALHPVLAEHRGTWVGWAGGDRRRRRSRSSSTASICTRCR